MKPIPDRRQQPRIPGMVVTQPAPLDDAPLHILTPAQLGTPQSPHHTCDQLGGCQGRGNCNCQTAPREAGNIWFAEPEPDDTIKSVGWPVSGLQIAACWMLLAALSLLIVGMSVAAAGLAHGMAPAEIVGALLAFGVPQ